MEVSSPTEPAVSHEFQKLSETIGTNIQKISQNVSSMQKLVNQFKVVQDTNEIRNQFNQIQNYTQQLAKDTSGLLKTMMAMPLTSPDHRQNKLRRERLSEEFMSALNIFQATQRLAAKKNAAEVKKIKAQNFNIGDPFALGSQNNSQLIEMEASNIRRQEQLQIQAEEELRIEEERERQSAQLESNIISVNEIFKEFAAMVHDQAEVVDSIEANIDRTSGYVESGTQQLHQASNFQTKLRKKKFYILIVLLIIIAILVIVFTTRSG